MERIIYDVEIWPVFCHLSFEPSEAIQKIIFPCRNAEVNLIRPYSWRRQGTQFCRLLHVVLLKLSQHLN